MRVRVGGACHDSAMADLGQAMEFSGWARVDAAYVRPTWLCSSNVVYRGFHQTANGNDTPRTFTLRDLRGLIVTSPGKARGAARLSNTKTITVNYYFGVRKQSPVPDEYRLRDLAPRLPRITRREKNVKIW